MKHIFSLIFSFFNRKKIIECDTEIDNSLKLLKSIWTNNRMLCSTQLLVEIDKYLFIPNTLWRAYWDLLPNFPLSRTITE